MNIHQLNVSHNERQDRLLLRVNTHTAEEFRFWLTRRLSLLLLPALQQTLGRVEASQPHTLAPDAGSRQILTDLKHEAFKQQADFKTPYAQQPQRLPLGEEPMLVTDVQFQQQNGGMVLTLQDKGAESGTVASCQISLQAHLLHGLIHLLGQAVELAQWAAPQAAPEAGSVSTSTPPEFSGYRH